MPLCCVEVEQAVEDDLVELSEIEKQNLGQTFQMDSMSETNNSPQSLLAFIGHANVHGLYDFLLNYRFYLNSFTGVDVPVLYAPVPFQNGSLSVPETKGSGRAGGTTSDGKKKRSEESSETVLSKKSKHKTSNASSVRIRPPKVKLQEKISALQQIVSPFGSC